MTESKEADSRVGRRAARKAAKRPRSEAKPSEAWAPAKESRRAKAGPCTSTVNKGFDLETTYLVLADGPEARRIEVGPDFWQTIDERDDLSGRLVAVFRYDKAWPTWEVHPDGDEIVVLLSGAVDLVLEGTAGERIVELRDRAACVVPRGVWHTANVLAPSEALHITRGDGTRNRPR